MQRETIELILNKYAKELISLPGVVAVAQGEIDHESCIKIFVSKKTRKLVKQIPSSLEGYRVIIKESGGFRALDEK